MRNKLLVTIGFLLIFSTGYSKVDEFKIFEKESKGIKIQINSKLELFHIMAYLSNADYLNNFDFTYKSDITTFFASYKNDNSVQFVKKVIQNYHAHLSINEQFLNDNFKNNPSFMQFLQLDSFELASTLTNKTMIIDSLNKAVESFAKISQFDKFINNHQEYYLQKIDEVSKEIMVLTLLMILRHFGVQKRITIQ